MSLSLIIPVYNESNQISYTLNKLNKIKDKIKKFEIILIDDFSTDNSIEVINKIASKKKYIKLFRNKKRV